MFALSAELLAKQGLEAVQTSPNFWRVQPVKKPVEAPADHEVGFLFGQHYNIGPYKPHPWFEIEERGPFIVVSLKSGQEITYWQPGHRSINHDMDPPARPQGFDFLAKNISRDQVEILIQNGRRLTLRLKCTNRRATPKPIKVEWE